jgi:hypothetical protein
MISVTENSPLHVPRDPVLSLVIDLTVAAIGILRAVVNMAVILSGSGLSYADPSETIMHRNEHLHLDLAICSDHAIVTASSLSRELSTVTLRLGGAMNRISIALLLSATGTLGTERPAAVILPQLNFGLLCQTDESCMTDTED